MAQSNHIAPVSHQLYEESEFGDQKQRLLLLMIHASECGKQLNSDPCSYTHCITMKNILIHISSCTRAFDCNYSKCIESREVINHWKSCCIPNCKCMKHVILKRKLNQTPLIPLRSDQKPDLCRNSQNVDWRLQISRTSEVEKLLRGLIPNFKDSMFRDPRLNRLKMIVDRIEGDAYRMSKSVEEYSHRLQEKLVGLHKVYQLRKGRTQEISWNYPTQSATETSKTKRIKLESLQQKMEQNRATVVKNTYCTSSISQSLKQIDVSFNKDQSLQCDFVEDVIENYTLDVDSDLKLQMSQDAVAKTEGLLVNPYNDNLFTEVQLSSQSAIGFNRGLYVQCDKLSAKNLHNDDIPSFTILGKLLNPRAEMLRNVFTSILEKMWIQCPESLPFREPVDPDKLRIPDYFSIIKEPIDLLTIRRKLDTGEYSDAWSFVNDIWLMFENAWLYNKRNSYVYKCCTKLSETFKREIDPVMNKLGHCCGRRYYFNPQTLYCQGNRQCTILSNAKYLCYQNRIIYCLKCFSEIPGDYVDILDSISNKTITESIPKHHFVQCQNSRLDLEHFVECLECGRKSHQICVLHLHKAQPEGFICNHCLMAKGLKRTENKFTAKRLPQTKLGTFIENRVNDFLRKRDCSAVKVSIRVVSSSDKFIQVKDLMRQKYFDKDDLPDKIPYRSKTILAFTEINRFDVCFFGFYVQEYGTQSSLLNSRCVYLSYLDSVNFFSPKKYRTDLYHEILLGYMNYVKLMGFVKVFIWACPPLKDNDYIFHRHPGNQKVPTQKRLQAWYDQLFKKGSDELIITSFNNIFDQAKEDNFKSATELPYFEGDFWPNLIEESIKEIEVKQQNQIQAQLQLEESGNNSDVSLCSSLVEDESENVTTVETTTFKSLINNWHVDFLGNFNEYGEMNEFRSENKTGMKDCLSIYRNQTKQHRNAIGIKVSKNKQKQRKNNKYNANNNSAIQLQFEQNQLNQQQWDQELNVKLYGAMEKHKDVYFVICLNNTETANLPPISDPDDIIHCDLMDGRDAFLTMAREKHYEFSSLRRATFSTMALLYELHNGNDGFLYTCNNCQKHITETRYHCKECDDFDLCVNCFTTAGHGHQVEKYYI